MRWGNPWTAMRLGRRLSRGVGLGKERGWRSIGGRTAVIGGVGWEALAV